MLSGVLIMLPKFVYLLLPYFYIGVGLFCTFFFASPLIFFSSAVFILTGGLVLWMRHNNTVDPAEYINAGQTLKDKVSAHLQEKGFDSLSNERRFFPKRSFPLLDGDGAMIAFDRRLHGGKA